MSDQCDTPRSLEEQLLKQPRRTAGMDGYGQPVRLGERDSGGHVVGYIDEDGHAWESLTERIVAVRGQQLAEVVVLPDGPRRDELMDQVLGDVPDELITEVAREAAGHFLLKGRAR
jgi:hypothetical protein